ncbi:hypothetical protein GCM10009779_66230 [Polymorphospora rubra]|uniref:Uncharacterized protein n=1 Tax=Polymorphospora rubra TaxID=338584 RepID=A0A810MW79_9ACTN|nr:hypothetical protein Prubr_18310 [Polymorphospora rubra]
MRVGLKTDAHMWADTDDDTDTATGSVNICHERPAEDPAAYGQDQSVGRLSRGAGTAAVRARGGAPAIGSSGGAVRAGAGLGRAAVAGVGVVEGSRLSGGDRAHLPNRGL